MPRRAWAGNPRCPGCSGLAHHRHAGAHVADRGAAASDDEPWTRGEQRAASALRGGLRPPPWARRSCCPAKAFRTGAVWAKARRGPSALRNYRLFMSGPLDGGAGRPVTGMTPAHAIRVGIRPTHHLRFLQSNNQSDDQVYQEVYNGPDTAYTKVASSQPPRSRILTYHHIFRQAMLATGTVYYFRVSAVNHNGRNLGLRELVSSAWEVAFQKLEARAGAARPGRRRPACCREPNEKVWGEAANVGVVWGSDLGSRLK